MEVNGEEQVNEAEAGTAAESIAFSLKRKSTGAPAVAAALSRAAAAEAGRCCGQPSRCCNRPPRPCCCCCGKQEIKFISLDLALPSDYEQAAAAGKPAPARGRPGYTRYRVYPILGIPNICVL